MMKNQQWDTLIVETKTVNNEEPYWNKHKGNETCFRNVFLIMNKFIYHSVFIIICTYYCL